jgi:hypothetical protein
MLKRLAQRGKWYDKRPEETSVKGNLGMKFHHTGTLPRSVLKRSEQISR